MRTRWSLPFALILSTSSLACGSTNPAPPAGDDAGARRDAGVAHDAHDVHDAGDAQAVDAGAPTFTGVSASSTGHACAVRSDGSLWCWGLNDRGQLGRPVAESGSQCRVRNSDPPRSRGCETRARRVTAFSDVTEVAVGNGSTCALRRDGSVWCWGLNDAGELGQGSGNLDANPTPVRVAIPAASSVALGAFHACAVLRDGAVRCWGSNKFGQAGQDPTASSRCDEGDGTLSPCTPTPVAVQGISNARSISLGRWHSCAVLEGGSVRCWGLNDSAQLGTGTADPPNTARFAPSSPAVDRVRAVSSGGSHTCALREDGSVRCWGWADLGQLGGAPTATCGAQSRPFQCAAAPAAIPGASAVAQLAAGRYHTCLIGADGAVRCAGRNDNGQVGVEPSIQMTCASPPESFPCRRALTAAGVTPSSAASLGDYHSCALTRAGEVRCWGWNQFGQLGDGTNDDRPAGVRVLLGD